jgi:F-type H+-transporting ATPase subunit a
VFVIVLAAAAGDSGFEPPGPADFWQPLIGNGAFAVTRPAVVLLISVALTSWWLLATTRRVAVVPSKGQYFTESVYGLVRNSVARDIIGSHDFLKFVPLLFTMFVLILVNNLFGITPLFSFPTMSRIGFPVALMLVVFVLYHVLGVRKHGLAGYFKSLMPAGLPVWMVPIIYPLELLTYFFTRPVTLALRLFGNMFAGHLLLLLFITGGDYLVLHSGNLGLQATGLFSWVMAFVMTVFEILVEFLQAYIFTLLAAMYIAGSLAEEH